MDIQPNDFKYTLTIGGRAYALPQAPTGWEDSTLQWARSLEYFGMFRSFSVPIKFVLDGAWLLRREMYTKGVDGHAELMIELLDRKTWAYEILYKGDIDFSTFEDTLTEVEAKLMELGVGAAVAAFSNVEYEWTPREADTVQVRLPGIDRVEMGMQAFNGIFTGAFSHMMPQVFISCNEIESNAVYLHSVDYKMGWDGSPDYAFLLAGASNQEVRMRGQIELSFIPSNPNNYFIVRFGDNQASNGTTLKTLVDTRDLTPGANIVDFDFSHNIIVGRSYFISVVRYGGLFPDVNFSIDFATMHVTVNTTTDSTVVQAFRPKRVFEMLLERMQNQITPVQSNILEQWDNLLIASGDMIRGISGASFKTNFNDFYKSINAVLNTGFSVPEGVPTIEEKNYYFRSILLALDLGESAKEVSVRPAEDFMFNSIKAGYPDDDYDVDRGREEFNSGQIWGTNIKRVQKQLDLSSAYRADQYGIEQLRLARENMSDDGGDSCTTPNAREVDKKNDNEVFFIHAQKTPGSDGIFDVIGAEAYSEITGISSRSSSYNLGISPKKNLLRHSNYLAGALYNNSFGLRFESADKNAELSTTTLAGQTVRERDTVMVTDMGSPLFLPYRVDLVTDLQFDAWKLLQTNSTGYIRFVWRGHEFYGYVLEVSQNIERNTERALSLLLSPNSDITKLIF